MGDVVSEAFNMGMHPSVTSLIVRNSAPFTTCHSITYDLHSSFQFLFYGAYIILGGVYILLQLRQVKLDKKFQHPIYPISLLVLFVLATGGIIVSVYEVENVIEFVIVELAGLDATGRARNLENYRTAISALFGTANWVADGVLVYRCYHVWNRKIWIPLVPAVLSVINAAISYAAVATKKAGGDELFMITTGQSNDVTIGGHLNFVFLGVIIFNNLLLTGLIAGRIWWLNRVHARLLGIDGQDKRLNAIVSMLVESGTLYPTALIICLIIEVKGSPATMTPILLQVVPEGIVPTLIMVRTLLGLGVGGSPHRSVEAEAEVDGDLEPPTLRYTDVKRKWSNATSSFPSESAASPSRYTYVHDDLHGTLVCEPLEIPAYHRDRESNTGYQSEKQQIELRYEPREASAPTTSFGTVEPPSSSSKQQHF